MENRKTVLITGASGGIGHATAERFLSKGYKVVLHGNERYEEILRYALEEQRSGREAYAFRADLLSEDSIRDMCDRVTREVGSVHVLVNNAGTALPQKLITECSTEEWDKVFAVNVRAPFLLSKAFLPGMIAAGGGCIINIASIWGISGGACETAYSASKAALIGLTKSLAREAGLSHIRVNCIAPGWIETRMNAHLSEEDRMEFCGETALGTTGAPREVASAVLYLASEDAAYITGQVLAVDGGFLA